MACHYLEATLKGNSETVYEISRTISQMGCGPMMIFLCQVHSVLNAFSNEIKDYFPEYESVESNFCKDLREGQLILESEPEEDEIK